MLPTPEALVSLCGPGLVQEGKVFEEDQIERVRQTVKTVALKLRKGNEASISPEQWLDVKKVLWAYWHLQNVTPAIKLGKLNVENTLAAMVHPLNKFPEQYQSLANELLEYYRSINWGAPEVVASTPSSNQRHRSTASAASTGEGSSTSYKRPPPDHPIYGRSGIFRHIQRSSGGSSTVSYRVDPDFRSRAYDVFGANGLSVGDWWPLQICANRDGAHGPRVAGIAGNASEGAYSIVVAAAYDDEDLDKGDELVYSSVKVVDSTSNINANTGVKALRRSIITQKPVRVLRRAGCKWHNGPACGLRYDGLYEVVSAADGQKVGDKVQQIKFYLVRVQGQVPIDVSKPSRDQISEYERSKRGY